MERTRLTRRGKACKAILYVELDKRGLTKQFITNCRLNNIRKKRDKGEYNIYKPSMSQLYNYESYLGGIITSAFRWSLTPEPYGVWKNLADELTDYHIDTIIAATNIKSES